MKNKKTRAEKKEYRRLLKRTISGILVVLMLFMTTLSGCSKENDKTAEPTAPVKDVLSGEASDNVFRERFSCTLPVFTSKVNSALKSMDPSDDAATLDSSQWAVLSSGHVDDNGVVYSLYSYPTPTVTYAAAVEEESRKLMSVGICCSMKRFTEDDLKTPVMLMASLMAIAAGGYSIDTIDYFYGIFEEAIASKNGEIFYDGAVYGASVEKREKSDSLITSGEPDDGTMILDITAAQQSAAEERKIPVKIWTPESMTDENAQ